MKLSIFIFTRDFRLEDNTGLIKAKLESDIVIPCFVFNHEQIDNAANKYYNENCVRFMIECLIDLDKKLRKNKSKLYLFYGNIYEIMDNLIKKLNIYKIYINEDITPYAVKRSKKIKKICEDNEIDFSESRDLFLLKNSLDKKSYMFTSYYNKVLKEKIPKPNFDKTNNYYNKKLNTITFDYIIDKLDLTLNNMGGRDNALKKLFNLQTPSGLSPYIKFGCLSPREMFWYVKKKHGINEFIRQIIWRDFYYQLYHHDKNLFTFKQEKKWGNNKYFYKKWCNGETGYPIIDAAMRDLKTTGNMPNKLRLLVSCFLIKILYIDWKLGEKWFAKYLVDYDPIVNNGNWQWIAGTHRGSRLMWVRILNPWIQSKKLDKDCTYIKKWVPELEDVKCSDIHKYNETRKQYENNYCDEIINFDKEKLLINKKK